MTFEERDAIFAELQSLETKLLASKGRDYAGDKEALNNFKSSAERYGTTKYMVWLIYAGKHLDAIINAIKANPSMPKRNSESLDESIKDARNYLGLLACLLHEDLERKTLIVCNVCGGPHFIHPTEEVKREPELRTKHDHVWVATEVSGVPVAWCKCGAKKNIMI